MFAHNKIFTYIKEYIKSFMYSNDSFIRDYLLNTIIPILKNLNDPAANSSIEYLKRIDVQNQIINYINQTNEDIELETRMGKILDIIYIEINIKSNDQIIATMNLWPCSHCACVSYQPIN